MSTGPETTASVPPALDADKTLGADAWWMVFVLFTFYLMSQVDRSIIAHLVDPIKKSLVLSDFQMGLVLGPSFAFAYSLAAFPGGWIVDRFDRRIVVGCAMLFWSLMTISCGFANGVLWLAFSRMMVAVGESVLTPAAYSMIGDRFPRRRVGSAIAFYNTGAKAGASIAYFVAALAIASAYLLRDQWAPAAGFEMWQIVFFLVAIPGLFLALLPLTFRKIDRTSLRGTSAASADDDIGFGAFMKARMGFMVPFFCASILVATSIGSMGAWLPTFMQRNFGWAAVQYGPPIGTITAIAALLTIPQGILVDRLYASGMRDSALRYLTWMLMLALPFSSAAFFLTNPWYFLGCLFVFYAVVLPYVLHIGITIQVVTPPHIRGRVSALTVALIPVFSQGLGPLMIGAMTDFVFEDPQKIGTALAITTITGLVGALILFRYTLKKLAPLVADRAATAPA